jgi:hypothetical protein
LTRQVDINQSSVQRLFSAKARLSPPPWFHLCTLANWKFTSSMTSTKNDMEYRELEENLPEPDMVYLQVSAIPSIPWLVNGCVVPNGFRMFTSFSLPNTAYLVC